MKEAGDDEEMVVSKKALQLKKYFETAMSGSDGVDRYIPQFCDGLTKRIEKDYKKHQDEMDKMSRDIVEKICNQGFKAGLFAAPEKLLKKHGCNAHKQDAQELVGEDYCCDLRQLGGNEPWISIRTVE